MMTSDINVGILGTGVYLPEEVRTNDWWPQSVTAEWLRKRADSAARLQQESASGPISAGTRKVLEAIESVSDDPFQGAVQRRVMPETMASSDMEVAAALDALERAKIEPGEIEFVLSQSVRPDYLKVPNACIVHENLGLNRVCFSMAVDDMCNAFMAQLEIASSLVSSGRMRYGLLTQSSAFTSMVPPNAQYSAWCGDGATAVVVGPAAPGYGVLGRAHRTDGSMHDGMVFGVPGKKWFEDGRIVGYPKKAAVAWRMLLSIADFGKDVLGAALEDAGLTVDEVQFYASHQATAWFRAVTQEHAGMHDAKSTDTFPWAGSLSAANIPLVLAIGEREGLLKHGDIVAAYSGGNGITYSGLTMRWGVE